MAAVKEPQQPSGAVPEFAWLRVPLHAKSDSIESREHDTTVQAASDLLHKRLVTRGSDALQTAWSHKVNPFENCLNSWGEYSTATSQLLPGDREGSQSCSSHGAGQYALHSCATWFLEAWVYHPVSATPMSRRARPSSSRMDWRSTVQTEVKSVTKADMAYRQGKSGSERLPLLACLLQRTVNDWQAWPAFTLENFESRRRLCPCQVFFPQIFPVTGNVPS
jgi:hypothetical protein